MSDNYWAEYLSGVQEVLDDLAKSKELFDKMRQLLSACVQSGGTVFWFGNGGSAADAQHLAAELVGRVALDRRPLRSIALTSDSAVVTALSNDYGYDRVFARQIEALGEPGDVAIGISTSGKSPNVVRGLEAARKLGMVTVLMTGRDDFIAALLARVPVP